MNALPLALVLTALAAPDAAPAGAPLPAAPIRVVVPDVPSFDAALSGEFRKALSGGLSGEDRFVAAWRRTQVGSKLEDQWDRLAGDLPWTWDEILALKARSLGLALLEVGHLEVVLAVETPLAALPDTLPAGSTETYAGATYHLVTRGAADGAEDPDRRMGLAWARDGGWLFLATSERALKLTLDEALAKRRFAAPLPGLVSMELDLDALRKDRYFTREFLFGNGPETGRLRAALRQEGGQLVEVREGTGKALPAAFLFDAHGAAAAAWESGGADLLRVLRAALLEPYPTLSDRPATALGPLPVAAAAGPTDRYLVNLEQPAPVEGAAAGDPGELSAWRALFEKQPVTGWGYLVTRDGGRRIVFPWPARLDDELVALCRTTIERRAGRAVIVKSGETREIRVGPDLVVAALRRTGDFLWLGPTAATLADAPTPRADAGLVRWAQLDLDAVRAEAPRWEKVEGPGYADETRPLSDRVLGLLGWIPATSSLRVERRQTEKGWSERLVFGTAR